MKVSTGKKLILAAVLAAALPVSAGWAESGGSVSGSVKFDGSVPAAKPISFGGEKQCLLMHGDKAPNSDEIVIGSGGGLQAVVVSIKEVVPGTYPAPTEPVVIDQHKCVFSPRIVAARVGQPIEFRNDDPVLHNVRAASKKKQSFNIAQPTQGMKTTKVFKEAEAPILLKCDVHMWMVGYLHVFAHPFFAVTKDDGAFSIKGLPAGTYTLEAWHEKLGTQTQTITVKEGEPTSVAFSFKAPSA